MILVVSLSRDTLALNPTSLLHNLVDSMLSEEEENTKITLVTYGANGEFYPPYIRTVNGEISSADRVQLASAISRLEFTGPSYSGASTVDALRFVTQNFQNSNLGVAKAVVVVAPESPTQNLVGLTSTELERQFSSEMMSLNVVSLLNEQDCQGLQLNIIHGISGRCYLPSEIPTLVSNLAQQRSDTVGRSIFCTCNLMDYLTGALSTTCAFN
uniref:VWFA domain-containing protein n=1 Tax=Ciona savignyi TaxID=51511 RepID=H2YVV6_CIOSA